MRLRPSPTIRRRNRARCRRPRHTRLPISAIIHRKARRTPLEALPKGFPQFSRLPYELQLKIWDLSLPPPRIIRIFQSLYDGFLVHRFIKVTIPPILQVCKRIREEYIKHYEYVSLLPTSRGSEKLRRQWERQQSCYINFERDIIFLYAESSNRNVQLSGRGLFEALGESWKKIRHIAIENNDVDVTTVQWVLSLKRLEKLRRIDIACNGFINLYKDDIFFHRPIEENQHPLLDWHITWRFSWEHLLQAKTKSLGLSTWSRPLSLDFVTLCSSEYYYVGPHFWKFQRWMFSLQ